MISDYQIDRLDLISMLRGIDFPESITCNNFERPSDRYFGAGVLIREATILVRDLFHKGVLTLAIRDNSIVLWDYTKLSIMDDEELLNIYLTLKVFNYVG